jgi:hypothetical protein
MYRVKHQGERPLPASSRPTGPRREKPRTIEGRGPDSLFPAEPRHDANPAAPTILRPMDTALPGTCAPLAGMTVFP